MKFEARTYGRFAGSLRSLVCAGRSMLVVGGLFVCSASIGHADPAELAPPGPCAEPREAVTGAAPSAAALVGPLQSFFAPSDVAAAPVPPSRPAPAVGAAIRPNACDRPGAGCSPSPIAGNPPIVPGGRPRSMPQSEY